MPTVLTASTASMTLPGPTGSPAVRKVRAKCIRLASSRPAGSDLVVGTCTVCRLGLDLPENARGFAAVQPGDVVLIFEQHAQRVVDRVRRQFEHVELHQGFRPVDRLPDARQL